MPPRKPCCANSARHHARHHAITLSYTCCATQGQARELWQIIGASSAEAMRRLYSDARRRIWHAEDRAAKAAAKAAENAAPSKVLASPSMAVPLAAAVVLTSEPGDGGCFSGNAVDVLPSNATPPSSWDVGASNQGGSGESWVWASFSCFGQHGCRWVWSPNCMCR